MQVSGRSDFSNQICLTSEPSLQYPQVPRLRGLNPNGLIHLQKLPITDETPS